MTRTSTHTCVYFDDGGPEHVCVCGARALLVPGADGADEILVALHDGTAPVTALVPTRRVRAKELAVSA